MNIALFGATGHIGRLIAQEAISRGHQVTGIVRDLGAADRGMAGLRLVKGDATDPASVAKAVAGNDVVISAIGPTTDDDPQILAKAARSLPEGLKHAGVKRLVVLGGAGSLQTASGGMLMDSAQFPSSWKPVAMAHYEALKSYRAAKDIDWTFLSPADRVEPGARTGVYRTGLDQVVRDEDGKSAISPEDLAVALVDEVEQSKHIKQRFTAAY